MTDMSMMETLQIWNDGVAAMERGDYQTTLKNFMALEGRTDSTQILITSARNLFNIGKTYLNLGRDPMATQAFEEALDKDRMLAVAHFMLGCTNLRSDRNSEALKNFDDALFYLRGNKLIDYKQLGLHHKLYDCEILTNRAIAYSRLGIDDSAREDFLQALQCTAKPIHELIEDALLSWRSGTFIQHIELPANAVFRPAKSKIDAMNQKPDFLGKAKVLVGKPSVRKPPPTKQLERNSLLSDLRKKETRKSLKKVETRNRPPSKALPVLPEVPPPSSRSLPQGARLVPPGQAGPNTIPRSPKLQRRSYDVITHHDRPNRLSGDIGHPPNKPLPPSPRGRSPVPPRSPVPARRISREKDPDDTSVTFQLVVTRTVKVSTKSSLTELSQAAAKALEVPEDSFALWYTTNDGLTSLENLDVHNLLESASGCRPMIYCYEK